MSKFTNNEDGKKEKKCPGAPKKAKKSQSLRPILAHLRRSLEQEFRLSGAQADAQAIAQAFKDRGASPCSAEVLPIFPKF